MFKLFKINDDKFVIKSPSKLSFIGNYSEIVEELKDIVDLDEIQFAVANLIEKNHEVADFGVNNIFTFSYNRL